MRILINTTSPYARVARIALREKGLPAEEEIVDPWGDTPALLAVNPSARVPAVIAPSGAPLTESLLAVLWLEHAHPTPPLIGADADRDISRAGLAYGVIEASVHTLVGRNIISGSIGDPAFDATRIGLRRRRTIANGLAALDADPPGHDTPAPGLGAICAIVALDYPRFRFPGAPWMPPCPALDALCAAYADRPSIRDTRPHA